MHHFGYHDYVFLNPIFQGGSQSVWPEFWGGFTGAFFAFLFGLISYWLIKRFERFLIHQDALVKLERALNDAIDGIGLNRKVSTDVADLLGQRKLTFSRLIPFELPLQTSIDIASIVLVNHFYTYERGVHRVNADMKSMNYALTRFEDLLIGGQTIDPSNFELIRRRLTSDLLGFLTSLDGETRDLLSRVRLYFKKLKGKNLFLFANTHTRWDIEMTDQEIAEERRLLDSEIAAAATRVR